MSWDHIIITAAAAKRYAAVYFIDFIDSPGIIIHAAHKQRIKPYVNIPEKTLDRRDNKRKIFTGFRINLFFESPERPDPLFGNWMTTPTWTPRIDGFSG